MDHFILVCTAGYFRENAEICVMCIGNTIKTRIGDAKNCDADLPCDVDISVPNQNHTACGR